MLIGVIADDFTGASDIANTLAKGGGGAPGLATTQFLGVPSGPAPATCQAGVVSLKTRSVPVAEAVANSLAALRWLKAQGCRQFFFKYCSTFDSTEKGNIGPVGEALAAALGVRGVVVCPAFPQAGRTLYMGNLFVGDVPLNESSLRNHPLTPMTDSDLRRWLRKQCSAPVGFVPWKRVSEGASAVRNELDAAGARGEILVVVDAVTDDDLFTIGAACSDAILITGGSGVAMGLPRNFHTSGRAGAASSNFRPARGREAILAGSCSQATLAQIAEHERGHPTLQIPVAAAMAGEFGKDQIVSFIEQNEGNYPLVYTSQGPEHVRFIQQRYGTLKVAETIDQLFADTARALTDRGLRRLVVAGGETSGAVASALGYQAFDIGAEIAPGVPAVSAGDGKLALALKSGNFGGPDFFKRAVDMLGTA